MAALRDALQVLDDSVAGGGSHELTPRVLEPIGKAGARNECAGLTGWHTTAQHTTAHTMAKGQTGDPVGVREDEGAAEAEERDVVLWFDAEGDPRGCGRGVLPDSRWQIDGTGVEGRPDEDYCCQYESHRPWARRWQRSHS